MPTVIQIMSTEWLNDTTNGIDFTTSPANFTKTITGNVDEKVMVKGKLRTWTYVELNDYYVFSKLSSPNGSIYCKGAFGEGSGVSVGDRVRLVIQNGYDYTDTIISVSDDIIYLSSNNWNIDITYPKDYLFIITDLNDCRYSFGLYQDSTSITSTLDGSDQTFKIEGLDHSTQPTKFGVPIGLNWLNGGVRMRFEGYNKVPFDIFKARNTGADWLVAQDFYFEHYFIIQNYTESQGQEIINGIVPLDYIGKLTYNYYANIQLFKSLNEPNTKKEKGFISDGNIGWYNENFNGTNANKSITDLEFKRFDTNEIISGLCAEKTKIKFKINNCTSATKVVLRHKRLIKTSEYYLKNGLYNDLFSNQIIRLTNSNPTSYGNFSNARILLNGTTLTVEADLLINSSELVGDDYLLSCSVEESKENRSNLIVKTGEYIGGFDVFGLVSDATFSIKHRAYTQSFSKLNLMLDELVKTTFDFSLVHSLGATLQDLEVRTVLTNGVDNITLDFDKIDLSGLTTVNGIQKIDSIINDSYGLDNGFIKYINNDAVKTDYSLSINYRVPSQKHIKNINVPSVFFNPSEKNNGLNIDTFSKQNFGYDIKIGLYLNVSGTEYLFLSEKIEINNYEQKL